MKVLELCQSSFRQINELVALLFSSVFSFKPCFFVRLAASSLLITISTPPSKLKDLLQKVENSPN
jgi:hypothetical protein